MIPVRDVVPTRTKPYVTVSILVLTAVSWAVVAILDIDPYIASIFMPASIQFVAINMLFLWIFGENVEDRLGRSRFVGLYTISATSAALLASLTFPMLDASSGALAGVMGAYVLLFPRSRVLVLVPIPLKLFEVHALLLVVFWFVLQLLTSVRAYVAIGLGTLPLWEAALYLVVFAIGALLCLALRRPERARVEWWAP